MTSTCHVKNVCEGLIRAAEYGRPGQAYFLTDGAPQNFKQFITAQMATQNITPPNSTAPLWLVYSAAYVMEKYQHWFGSGRPMITRQALLLLGESVTVDDSKARREIGYKSSVSIEEGLREMKEHFTATGHNRDF